MQKLLCPDFSDFSLALGVAASPVFHGAYGLWFTAFVGASLRPFGFTKVCPLGFILKKLGVKETCAVAS